MKVTRRWIAGMMGLPLMAVLLLGCASISTTLSASTPLPGLVTPAPANRESSDPGYAFAQATMDAGQSQLLDLSRKATEVGLDVAQAADDAAQSTQESIQRQQIELDYQATIINHNIAIAAITQEYIARETQIAEETADAAQSSAATATQSAYLISVNQTAQVQAILDLHVLQTGQAVAALTAYPMTATPLAVTQAALLMVQYDREKQSFEDKIVAPLIPVIIILNLLLISLGIVLAYRWYLARYVWPYRTGYSRIDISPRPLNMIDAVIIDQDPSHPQAIPFADINAYARGLSSGNTVHVEIVTGTEPPFAHWIAEVEHQLASEGRLNL